MDNRKYRFSVKFAVERDVVIEAEDLNYARGCGAFWSAASTTPAVARSAK